jgi:hypothetical protein
MADGEAKEARPQTWLLGGALTTLTTILAALGAVQLGMDRMLRNHPELVFFAFTLVIIAAVLGGIALTLEATASKQAAPAPAAPAPAPTAPAPAPTAPAPAPAAPAPAVLRTSRRLLIAGLVCFALAGILAVLAAVRTPADDEFPSITAGFTSGERPALTVSIKGAGLTSTEDLDIHIEGASGRDPKVEPTTQRLYTTRLGPSPSGHVDTAIEVPMTPGTYDRIIIKAWVNQPPKCQPFVEVEKESEPGCLIVLVPSSANRPQLIATWGDSSSQHEVLVVKLTGRDLRVDKSIALNVVGALRKGNQRQRTLAQSVLVPNSLGALESSWRIPVTQDFSQVCVAAITVAPPDSPRDFRKLAALGCPPTAREVTVWTTLRVPAKPFVG